MSILGALRDNSVKRSKSAQKLATYVLRDPSSILSMSTQRLAAEVSVSEPTVNRFCTGLGLKGFPDFKLTLAGELARRRPRVAENVELGDDTGQVVSKLFDAARASLDTVEAGLDHGILSAAAAALNTARSIVLTGLGASASVALDAHHKLMRFGIPVTSYSDIIDQRVMTANLQDDDVVICISYTGRTTAIQDIAQLSRQRGATVIGITQPGSPVAQHCDLVLAAASDEDTELYTPMTSRLTQLVLIDVLCTRLAVIKGLPYLKHLEAMKQVVSDTRSAQARPTPQT